MKKILFIASALAGLFFAASCQQELDQPETAGKTVTFTVEAPAAIQTKAIADGLNVDQLIYEVWITNDGLGNLTGSNAQRLIHADDVTMTAGKAEITVDLVNGQNFTILFWAQKKDMGVYNTANLNAVTYNEEVTEGNMTVHAANVDDLAAFYGVAYVVDNVAVKEDGVTPTNGKVTLTRPFAQVNLGTVKASTLQYTVDIKKSSMTLTNVPTVFNVVNGEVSTPVKMTFSLATTEALGKLPLNGSADKYWWAGMNYVFAGKEANTRLSEVSYAIETQLGGENGQLATVNNTIPSVPLRENYRTNIVGNLLTSKTDFEIFVDANFATPDFVEEVWNGSEISEPAYDEPTKTYSVEMASELAWIAAAVNGTLETRAAVEPDTFEGKTVKLTKDINLNGKEWTPIGNGSNHFKGIFDGNHKTISGLKVAERRDDRAALFGTVSGTVTFRNLTISGASIECPDFKGDFYGSALIGTAYGNVTIENVDVVDSYISGNNKVGALLAHDGVVSSLKIKDCNISNTTFEALNAEDGGSVGGLVGYFQGVAKGSQAAPYGEHYINNSSVTGCTFNVVNSTNTGKRANALLIGGLESKAGQELYISGCSASNNTWNEKFYVDGTEVTNGTFVSPYGALIGGERKDAPKGKVVIDGNEFVGLAAVPAEIDLGNGNTIMLSSLTADHKVVVKGNGTLVLNSITLTSAEGAALVLAEDANVTLAVNGLTTLTGAAEGILVPAEADLLINGTGNLVVEGTAGSGIAGSVTIDGLAHITAKGNGNHAFGIGGNGAEVVIKNSTVDYACGGHIQPLCINDPNYGKSEPEGGAAIGGAKVRIEKSTVTKVDGGSKAAAIGAQYHQSTEVVIFESTILEAYGGNSSAGIGGSRYSSDISESNKQISIVRIENSEVTATGGQFGAGIGAGYDTHCVANDLNAVNDIIIVNSKVTAQGGKYAAGIGTGYHSAALTGSIDAASTIKATSGEKTYKEKYSSAQNIGYGVVDPTREFAGATVTFTVNGKVIDAPFNLLVDGSTYKVYTVAGLIDLSQRTINGSEKVVLMSDIDLTGVEFNGLRAFNPETPNEFDGQNHTVTGLNYDNTSDSDYAFIRQWVGTIKNVRFNNCHVQAYGRNAIVASNTYASFDNVHVTNSSVESTYWSAGIIAGHHNSGSVSNCSVTDCYVKSNGATGAIVGLCNESAINRNFINCTVTGCTVHNTGSYGEDYCGALVCGMFNIGTPTTINFENCVRENNTIEGKYVGDLYYNADSHTINVK